MAVGTVSGLNLDEAWQLIATNTATSAASTTFSSLSGYKTYMIVNKNTNVGGATSYGIITFNGDTTAGNYGASSFWDLNTNARYLNTGIPAWSYNGGGVNGYTNYTIVQNADKTVPKITQGAGWLTLGSQGVWLGTSAITSITFTVSTGTFSGDIILYGIPA